MKEQIKAPEKIQLSDEEIANLSDAEFKTLVIRMPTEMARYGCEIQEEVKAMHMCRAPTNVIKTILNASQI